MTNDPYNTKGAGQPERRRRADRHTPNQDPQRGQQPYRGEYPPEDAAPLPLGSEPRSFVPPPPRPQASRPEVPASYDYERFPPEPQTISEYDDDEDDYAPRLWPKLLALVLGLLLIAAAGLYFLMPENSPDFLGTLRGGIVSALDGTLGLLGIKEE